MKPNVRFVFVLLVIAQAAHSVEECFTRLYDVFAPARFVSSLVSKDPAVGFLVVNAAILAFAIWCWAVPIRSGSELARGLVWFWALLEFGNGTGHSALALSRHGYFAGVGTAPLLLIFAAWLAVLQTGQRNRSAALS